jgi:hypothetical protein
MGRSELHVQVSNWLGERIGRTFLRGSEEWDVMVLLFDARPKWAAWVAASDGFRVVLNDRGHPGTEFKASVDCVELTPPEEPGKRREPCVPGVWYPLSWARCFSPKQNVSRRRLMTAMRAAVQEQIDLFRAVTPVPPCCPVTGEPIGQTPQVDHVAPNTFAALVDEFVRRFGTPEVHCESASIGPRLLDPSAWNSFHNERAQLRWVSIRGNQRAK